MYSEKNSNTMIGIQIQLKIDAETYSANSEALQLTYG